MNNISVYPIESLFFLEMAPREISISLRLQTFPGVLEGLGTLSPSFNPRLYEARYSLGRNIVTCVFLQGSWNASTATLKDQEAKNHSREEGARKRERAMAYAFSQQVNSALLWLNESIVLH